jgi:hypothetical protein
MVVAMSLASSASADHAGAGYGQTIGGPIVSIPASTLPAHRWSASVRLEWITYETFSDAELLALADDGIEAHSVDQLFSPSFGIAYGFTPRLTIGARIPHVSRSDIREGLDLSPSEVNHLGDSEGIGDMSLLAQVRATPASERPQFSLLFGLKLPTGETNERTVDGDLFEVEHQPGSGSVDPMLGAAWSFTNPTVLLDANLLGTITSEGEQQTNLGNLFQVNVATTWRLPHAGRPVHARWHEGRHSHLDLIVELNGEWRSRMEIADIEQPNTGGTLIYLTPGLRYHSPQQWSLSGALGIPVVQDLNGVQHETRLRGIVGFGVMF